MPTRSFAIAPLCEEMPKLRVRKLVDQPYRKINQNNQGTNTKIQAAKQPSGDAADHTRGDRNGAVRFAKLGQETKLGVQCPLEFVKHIEYANKEGVKTDLTLSVCVARVRSNLNTRNNAPISSTIPQVLRNIRTENTFEAQDSPTRFVDNHFEWSCNLQTEIVSWHLLETGKKSDSIKNKKTKTVHATLKSAY